MIFLISSLHYAYNTQIVQSVVTVTLCLLYANSAICCHGYIMLTIRKLCNLLSRLPPKNIQGLNSHLARVKIQKQTFKGVSETATKP